MNPLTAMLGREVMVKFGYSSTPAMERGTLLDIGWANPVGPAIPVWLLLHTTDTDRIIPWGAVVALQEVTGQEPEPGQNTDAAPVGFRP